jgi:hypothetical protein
MIWAYLPQGERAHLLIDGRPMCGVPGEHTRTDENPPHEERCQNCDSRWRKAGRAKRPKSVRPARERLTTYRPRNTFREDR